jgi:carbon-monoxide dehydrogenase medium subunit
VNLPPFDYDRPRDLASALVSVGEGSVPYCGGTELLAAMGMGLLQPERLTSLRSVPELRGLAVEDGRLRIGATTTHREVAADAQVQSASPLLADVVQRVGNSRVRATGTLGGNLAFAEPRSDLATALIALDALVVLQDASSARTASLADFLLGPYEADLRPGELLVRIEVTAHHTDVAAYRKMTVTERPVVGVAVVRVRETQSWRVVVGAVGELPLAVDVDSLDAVDAAGIAGQLDVTADHSGSEAYKRRVTEVTVRRCCQDAREQAERRSA